VCGEKEKQKKRKEKKRKEKSAKGFRCIPITY
jgi:hypothetical protein